MIVNLRYIILLNDYPTIQKESNASKESFNQLNQKTEAELGRLRSEVTEMLYKLENSYYSTNIPRKDDQNNVNI